MLAGRWRGASRFVLATPTARDAYDIIAYPVSTHCVYVSGGKGGGRVCVCVCVIEQVVTWVSRLGIVED